MLKMKKSTCFQFPELSVEIIKCVGYSIGLMTQSVEYTLCKEMSLKDFFYHFTGSKGVLGQMTTFDVFAALIFLPSLYG